MYSYFVININVTFNQTIESTAATFLRVLKERCCHNFDKRIPKSKIGYVRWPKNLIGRLIKGGHFQNSDKWKKVGT